MIGRSLGSYQVVAKLGEGGMGEVYRARDTKLNRDVALKILPPAFAADPDRLARFKREAHVLAALNHANIAQIYGFEDTSATHALVMELVDGPTLADRIAQGPIPLTEALPMARQLADALEAAHELGIIHRDLKPANVKLRGDGTVKVLDFGLAKALDTTTANDSLNSPTLTSPAMTAVGVILGTAAYMSPEQAKGRVVDKRADIWAFGVVLFEMLSGRVLFAGDSVVETIGFVATRDPDWTLLPAATPASVRRLLVRCLTRDPKHRLRDIGEARIALAVAERGEEDPVAGAVPALPVADADASAFRSSRTAAVVGAIALVAAALAAGWYWGSRGAATPLAAVAPFQAEIVPTPPDAFARNTSQRSFTFTPDGRALIYANSDPNARRLYRRDREATAAVPIAGTEGAYGPFVSPDNAWIGFFADGKMRRVPVGGGEAQTIHDMRSRAAPDALGFGWSSEIGQGRELGYGATWLTDGTIVYGRFFGGLWRVSVNGGPPTSVTKVDDGEIAHRLPHALPGGRAILFTAVRDLLVNHGASVDALDLATGSRTRLIDDATDGRYAGGHLLFVRNGALYSMRFDLASLETSGEPVRIADDVMHAVSGGSPGRASGIGQYDVSVDGTLAVLRGGTFTAAPRQLVWATREGKLDPLPVEPAAFLGPRISPDGTRLAVTNAAGLMIIGLRDGIATPLEKEVIFPVWSHDGAKVFVGLRRDRVRQEIHSVSLAGGALEPIVTGTNPLWPSSVSRDGRFLAYVESNPTTGNDIWVIGLMPKSAAVAVVATPASETHPMFSPDGKWLVYVVDDGDASGVYLRPFPGPGRVERITRERGSAPIWAPDGKSILYESLQQPTPSSPIVRQVTRVAIDIGGDRISLGTPEVFKTPSSQSSTPVSGFDINSDGTRALIMIDPPRPAGETPALPTLQLTVHADLAGAARK